MDFSLIRCLESSVQIILSLSSSIGSDVMDVNYDSFRALSGPFTLDAATIDRLVYSVDSTWISLSFAVIFLVICHVKGLVDGERDRGVTRS